MSVSKLKLMVTGQDVGRFLSCYFRDDSYLRFEGEWIQPLYEGEKTIDLLEFCLTASRFDVRVRIMDGERIVEMS